MAARTSLGPRTADERYVAEAELVDDQDVAGFVRVILLANPFSMATTVTSSRSVLLDIPERCGQVDIGACASRSGHSGCCSRRHPPNNTAFSPRVRQRTHQT